MTDLLNHVVAGPAAAPIVVLGPSLGTSVRVWEAQAAVLAEEFRMVRWDLPGHGGSSADLLPAGGGVADLGRLVLAVADVVGAERFAHVGVSLGGAVGAWLAAHHPDRITALGLVCSSADFGPPGPWRERAAAVRAGGMAQLAERAPGRWFSAGHATAGRLPAGAAGLLADHRGADPEAYARCCELLADLDLRGDLPRITAPTLVLAGREDRATAPPHSRALADAVPDAQLLELPHAAHLAPVERPAEVTAAVRRHLRVVLGTTDAPHVPDHAAGLRIRREVLGDAHVDRALAGANAFTAGFQDLITRYAWGGSWARGTFDRRTLSCMTLTALVAGGHTEELALHVRAAVTNGLTPQEIAEVLLHAAVYCGVPAANSAFAVADRVLRDLFPEGGPGNAG
ncbi:bifunctional 3-oxoadipate enol-lactonase/4-carboxymuconolactone decarboxylase PcaDC [Actinacidiphila acididurans]|uniref:Alpha/beta fold hydrolase n=1 Tax=Actinacidiphila acididurans TaxID=2784346 RepID=A0ABS2TJ51_9ACTN|nr:alpha/beta fold hydrolase [Actinacidiphila acididurans]MBM9503369.1 alpha/beta fold hydrolase [Actinacidiphila acididurans]